MATSPNFNWPEPDNTDLVKNGALAIRTAVNAIDTSLVDLKGGTSGQVLAKASNTDMDFSWVTDATGIPATIFDAKGDIIAASAADTAARLAVGANNTVLTADSSTATGLKWATPASNIQWTAVNAGGTSLSGSTTTISGITGANQLMVLFYNGSSTNNYVEFYARINNDSGSNYLLAGVNQAGSTTGNYSTNTGNKITIAGGSSSSTAAGFGSFTITGGNSSGVKSFSGVGATDAGGGSGQGSYVYGGYWTGSGTITEINFFPSAGTFDTGTVYVFKSA